MPKLFYCKKCHLFHHMEGSLFNIYKYKDNICEVCKNKLLAFEERHSNWIKIGFPIVILFSIIFFIWVIIETYYITPTNPSYHPLIVIGFFIFCSFLITIGFGIGLSIADDHAMANKVLKEHPELEKNKFEAQFKRLPNHCNKCNKELPTKGKKCPYCGYEQY